MSKASNRPADPAELRRRAEEKLVKVRASTGRLSSKADAEKLLHELSVHQIELEMVNEELRRANAEIEAGLARYTDLYDFAPVGYLTLDNEGKILSANLTAVSLLGKNRSRLKNLHIQQIVSDGDRPAFNDFLKKIFEGGAKNICEVNLLREGNTPLSVRIEAAFSKSGQECRAVLEDITEQKKLQHQLHQASKMEAIGQLAAGIAHDFNNLLTTILGYSELMLHRQSSGDTTRQMVEEIHKAGSRAAMLTRQLLAFSRKQVFMVKVQDLGEIVIGMAKMLRRLIGEDITLTTESESGLWKVRVDPLQVEQILLNLAANSRDAMPQGGSLYISAANAMVTESFAQNHRPLKPGHYVALTVQDTGCGMSKETLSHLFEPFFTTKEVGKGTGLGLPSVYGVVKQSGAHIDVTSEVGKGTTFRIWFPMVMVKEEKGEASKGSLKPLTGTETILVVEDEEIVLGLVKRVLMEQGYTVLGAGGGGEALEILKKKEIDIKLILTDVVMPLMNGRELARRATDLRPGVRVLFMSGYPGSEHEKDKELPPDTTIIQKPFSPIALARIVRETLDNPPTATGTSPSHPGGHTGGIPASKDPIPD
ncbi:MAG: Response regulator [Actinobacteria bacterium]|nr:Response regulator [Actinomycetota bacterium]